MERLLAATLKAGQVAVMMDDLGAHRPKRVGELIEQRGCELIFLPAYPPVCDLNPIEEALSEAKSLLRKAGARAKEAL